MHKMDPNPIPQFKAALASAEAAGIELYNAMSVSTIRADGMPSTRVVLLKDVDERGFVFYTNMNSPKVTDIKSNANVSLCVWWSKLLEQIRIEGVAEPVADEEADTYFATRDRGSQVSAWASQQSEIMGSREELERAVEACMQRFDGGPVPRPPHWSGLRVVPTRIEFWYGKADRLHERYLYTKAESGGWDITLLQP
ncbi:MAG: pyridoxamine 5'-phosphate oxidase [bacterium]|nr:pyridoxamine 5'-phosphate oxidase [bacterium]